MWCQRASPEEVFLVVFVVVASLRFLSFGLLSLLLFYSPSILFDFFIFRVVSCFLLQTSIVSSFLSSDRIQGNYLFSLFCVPSSSMQLILETGRIFQFCFFHGFQLHHLAEISILHLLLDLSSLGELQQFQLRKFAFFEKNLVQ